MVNPKTTLSARFLTDFLLKRFRQAQPPGNRLLRYARNDVYKSQNVKNKKYGAEKGPRGASFSPSEASHFYAGVFFVF